jgi:hypothetical protein
LGFRTSLSPQNLKLLLRFDTFSGRDDIESAAEANKRAFTPAEMTALKSELEAPRAGSGDLQTYSSRG